MDVQIQTKEKETEQKEEMKGESVFMSEIFRDGKVSNKTAVEKMGLYTIFTTPPYALFSIPSSYLKKKI
jgi:hypothetical protein